MLPRSSTFQKLTLIVLMITIVAGGLSFSIAHNTAAAETELSNDYTWKPLKTGAGGWVTGINIHKDGQVVYARTDVGGAYRWNEETSLWKQIVTAQSMPDEAIYEYGGVMSLVAAPSDQNRAYMAFRDSIYRSDDQGETWTKTGLIELRDISNGPGRQQGERLAVDPADADIVYFGSASQGLFKTEDGGANWTNVSAVPPSDEAEYGVGNVMFDASSKATQGTKTSVIYATVHEKGVYQSTDAGQSWQKISGGSGPVDSGTFQHIDIASNGTLYVAMRSPGQLWKFDSNTWTDISPSGASFSTVAVAPDDPQKLLAFRDGGDAWRSLDGGANWTSLTKSRTANDIPWLEWADLSWMSVGNIVFDPQVPDRLWFAEGMGVWRTTDINDDDINWVSIGQGIEELVSNDIVVPPEGNPVTAHWDRPIFYHADPDQFPTEHGVSPRFNSSWDLDYSAENPSFLVGIVSDHRFCCESDGQAYQGVYSTDGGQTWDLFEAFKNNTQPADLKFGNIAVAANDTDNIVWLPSRNKALHYSKDRGKTWTPVILPGTENMKNDQGEYDGGSHFQYYLNRKVLVADPVLDNTFYLYHNSNGMYRSTDGGENWENLASTDLPTGWAVGWFNATLKATPGREGHLYWTPGTLDGQSFPMYRSTDGGATWIALDQTADVATFGFGKASTADGYPTIYMQGRVNDEPGVWRSVDEGATWEKIVTYPLGIYDEIKAIDGDKEEFGKVYMGFGGVGFVYGQLSDSQQPQEPTPTEQVYLPMIQSLTLINADTDQPIAEYDPIPAKATLDLSDLPTSNLSIRANAETATVGSVQFALNGEVIQTENHVPYVIAGDANGGTDYRSWTPPAGDHTLTVAPYTQPNGQGEIGESITVNLTVTE